MEDKKCLILGGTGFIGINLANELLKQRHLVDIVDNFSRGKKDESLLKIQKKYPDRLKLFEKDLTKKKSFDSLDSYYDEVYVLASVVGVEFTSKMPDRLLFINSSIILNTCEWLKTVNCVKVLFTSTSENYVGAIEKFKYEVPTDENVPVTILDTGDSRSTYAITKVLGESFFLNYSKKFNFKCVIVRYHNVYGPRMGFKHVIPQVIQRVINKEEPFVIYNGNHTRAFNYINDAIDGTIKAMKKGKNGHIYHIGDPKSEITIKELVEFICEEMDYYPNFINGDGHHGSVSRRSPNINKSIKDFNYKPIFNWKTGVSKTINWYVEWLKSNKAYE